MTECLVAFAQRIWLLVDPVFLPFLKSDNSALGDGIKGHVAERLCRHVRSARIESSRKSEFFPTEIADFLLIHQSLFAKPFDSCMFCSSQYGRKGSLTFRLTIHIHVDASAAMMRQKLRTRAELLCQRDAARNF
jgi:hypothetical protein